MVHQRSETTKVVNSLDSIGWHNKQHAKQLSLCSLSLNVSYCQHTRWCKAVLQKVVL